MSNIGAQNQNPFSSSFLMFILVTVKNNSKRNANTEIAGINHTWLKNNGIGENQAKNLLTGSRVSKNLCLVLYITDALRWRLFCNLHRLNVFGALEMVCASGSISTVQFALVAAAFTSKSSSPDSMCACREKPPSWL